MEKIKGEQIYISSDYYAFVLKEANRNINEKHVNEIAKSMEQKGWVGSPIEVSEDEKGRYQVEDGQHRLYAAIQTNTPIHFMVVKPKSVHETAFQNSSQKPWSRNDYIVSYADENYSYKRINNLMNLFPEISITNILRVVGDGGNATTRKLKEGKYNVSEEQFIKGKRVLEGLRLINEQFNNLKINSRDSYIRMFIKLLRNDVIDAKRMADQIMKFGYRVLPPNVTVKQAEEELEKLYNYQKSVNRVDFKEGLKPKI